MRILVTNDDGVHSPGLWSLVNALKEVGEVVVVAPDRDQSGVGTAMTLLNVVDVHEVPSPVEGVTTHAVQGTPGDCVILGAELLYKDPFDMLVSGINQGANLGLDVLTSGTVGATFHSYFRGITSLAVSVAALSDVKFDAAAQAAGMLARCISRDGLPHPMLLNMNLPNLPPDKIEGVELTTLGPKAYLENVEERGDSRRKHYWIRHNRRVNDDASEGTDVWAVRHNRISITPIGFSFSPSGSFDDYSNLADEVTNGLGLTRGS